MKGALLLAATVALCFQPSQAFRPTRRLSSPSGFPTTTILQATKAQPWKFQGHEAYSEVTTPDGNLFNNEDKPSVILIHGFGCSSYYWRETVQALTAAGYTAHTLDLLGQGKSSKPGRADGIEYSIDLWASQVEEYAKQYILSKNENQPIVVMGNSLGSSVALSVASGDFGKGTQMNTSTLVQKQIAGICLYNCGVGMNSRNLLKVESLGPVQRVIFTALFDLLDALLFNNIPVLTYVLTKVVTRDFLRNALLGLYRCAENPASRVDDGLVDSFYYPAKMQGSVEALNQIYTNDAGPTPIVLHRSYPLLSRVPIHLIWGTEDQVTPLAGPVGTFYQALANQESSNVSMDVIEAGHIPFDEVPECNESMVQWMDSVVCVPFQSK
jgi:pimeloyl-ACP methyl ester carboxylesterase